LANNSNNDIVRGVVPPQLEQIYLTALTYWSTLTNGDLSAVGSSVVWNHVDVGRLPSRPALAYRILKMCELANRRWNKEDPLSAVSVTTDFVEVLLLTRQMLSYKDSAELSRVNYLVRFGDNYDGRLSG